MKRRVAKSIFIAVVKIQARFGDKDKETSIWMMGSVWLIANDVLVTAGHVSQISLPKRRF